MAGKQTVGEVDFGEFIRCPLRIGEVSSYSEAPEVEAAKETTRWLLQEAFSDRLPPLRDVRSHYETAWTGLFETSAMTRSQYQLGLRAVARISKCLYDLASDYLVMTPVTAYEFQFGRNIVRGEYAVLTRPKRTHEPFILRLRFNLDSQVEVQHRGPDPVNMLRWAHFRQWEIGHPQVRVLNYPLDGEATWTDFFNERVVREYLNSVASNLADKRLYPSPGEHCESCKLPVCSLDGAEAFHSRG